MSVDPFHLALTPGGVETARRVAGPDAIIHAPRDMADLTVDDVGEALRGAFHEGRAIVAVMAAGALVRLLAPALCDKRAEPPVIAIAEDGSAVVPLLGGHRGANTWAKTIAARLGCEPAITTAGDVRFGVALDEPPAGWALANPRDAKAAMASLLRGGGVTVTGSIEPAATWPELQGLPKGDEVHLHFGDDAPDGALRYLPVDTVVGVGCERGAEAAELIELVTATLSGAGVAVDRVAAVASLDLKADEAAVHAVAQRLDVPALFHGAETLEALTPRLASPSDTVFAEVGCHGVAEGAALATAGEDAALIVPKRKSARATCALARAPRPIVQPAGRARGRLFVVGIGPGSEAWRSPEVTRMVRAATDLVGYSLYLDLLGPLAKGRTRHDFDLGREEDRVRHAMELAGTGRDVALVCSGDAGIYAMATLVFELLDDGGLSDGAGRIGIEVSPGISALQAAAARAGAPLGHDFCTISLSDLLTPWPMIEKRVRAAAEGDFVIAFYNPVSRRRRTQLAFARDVLLAQRGPDTPVVLATNLGRDGERVRIVPLGDLQVDDVDMLTVVIVGSSDSRTVDTGDGRRWVYTPRGYAAKEGTGLAGAGGEA